ncbi:MAG TPA: 16S rRNA (uracil(1498)-N(3))-methyltransferase [Geobacteraceae bacterium]
MSLRRFILPPTCFIGRQATVSGEPYRHMVTVLRLAPGSRLLLADGSGREASGTIRTIDRESLLVDLDAELAAVAATAAPAITLYQGLPKGEKLDLILQKTTELGVAAIVPFQADRSVVRLTADRVADRVQRWQRIVLEAARQAGRSSVPLIDFTADLAAVTRHGNQELKLLLWEGETERGMKTVLNGCPRPASIAVLVGPEGGLTAAEAATAQSAGFIPVTLGQRILRTETAGLAVLAILQYEWGDLG